jgi:hypothetical protein
MSLTIRLPHSAISDPAKAPLQIATFIDGFQIAVRSTKALVIHADFKNSSEAKVQNAFKAASESYFHLEQSVFEIMHSPVFAYCDCQRPDRKNTGDFTSTMSVKPLP